MSNVMHALRLPDIADLVRQHGRSTDTILAHINPREAALLRAHGGAETINPATGLPEYDDLGLTQGYFSGETAQPNYNLQIDQPTDTGLTSGYFSGQTAQPDYNFNLGPSSTNQTPSFQPSTGAAEPQLNFGTTGATFEGATPSTFAQPSTRPIGDQVATALNQSAPAAGGGGQEQSVFGKAADFLGQHKDAASLLGIGALQAFNQRRANQQAGAAKKRIQDLAAPYRQQSNQYLEAARTGNLLPAQQQQLQAMRAQAAQNLASAGQSSGTAAQQAESGIQQQAELWRQNLMQTGLQLAGVADQLTLEAVNAGYQADQQAQQAANNFYLAVFRAIGNMGK